VVGVVVVRLNLETRIGVVVSVASARKRSSLARRLQRHASASSKQHPFRPVFAVRNASIHAAIAIARGINGNKVFVAAHSLPLNGLAICVSDSEIAALLAVFREWAAGTAARHYGFSSRINVAVLDVVTKDAVAVDVTKIADAVPVTNTLLDVVKVFPMVMVQFVVLSEPLMEMSVR
jgi:hypothetical protein